MDRVDRVDGAPGAFRGLRAATDEEDPQVWITDASQRVERRGMGNLLWGIVLPVCRAVMRDMGRGVQRAGRSDNDGWQCGGEAG